MFIALKSCVLNHITLNFWHTVFWEHTYKAHRQSHSIWVNYTEQNDKRNTFVFAPIFHELNSKIYDFFYVHKRPISLKFCSQICLNLC